MKTNGAGPAFLSYGFRPFFLFAGIYAVLAMAAWAVWIGLHAANFSVLGVSTDFVPFLWHAHEMLFGYTAAVIAGFVLTAVANWTGRRPVSGIMLALLAALWLAGRFVMWFSAAVPGVLVAIIDGAFLVAIIGCVLIEIAAARNWRNLLPLSIMTLLAVSVWLAHLSRLGVIGFGQNAAYGLALNTIVLLIAVIGGRIIPSFTANAFRRAGIDGSPRSYAWLDFLSLLSLSILLVAEAAGLPAPALAWSALAAAVLNLLRLAGWQGHKTLNNPILWILHVGYLWLVIGLAAKSLAYSGFAVPLSTANHALTVGAIGSMTIAMITRAALGHTGRPLLAQKPIAVAYVLISAAASTRIAVPLIMPGYYNAGMLLAAILWMVAFIIYCIVYAPILLRAGNAEPVRA